MGAWRDGGLTDELPKNLVVSSAATRTRLIWMAMHEQAERETWRVALAVPADLDTPWWTRCQSGEPEFVKLLAKDESLL